MDIYVWNYWKERVGTFKIGNNGIYLVISDFSECCWVPRNRF